MPRRLCSASDRQDPHRQRRTQCRELSASRPYYVLLSTCLPWGQIRQHGSSHLSIKLARSPPRSLCSMYSLRCFLGMAGKLHSSPRPPTR